MSSTNDNHPPKSAGSTEETLPQLEDASKAIESDAVSIGTVARVTGINIDTLRVWERRYGRPKPIRLESGHRRYPANEVRRLLLVSQLLERGHRPRFLAKASTSELVEILEKSDPSNSPKRPFLTTPDLFDNEEKGRKNLATYYMAIKRADGPALTQAFHTEWPQLGPLRFIEERAVPYLKMIGEAWLDGRMSVAEEHFASLLLSDFLTAQWRRMSERAPRRSFLLGSLSGDLHELGLTMAAVCTAAADHGVIYLGPQTPPDELIAMAMTVRPGAVAVSISATLDPASAHAWITELQTRIPADIPLVVGGDGAPKNIEGVLNFPSLRAYHVWAMDRN